MKYLPGHLLAGKNGYVLASRAVLFAAIGPGTHPCHWCGAAVEWRVGERGNRHGSLITDHVDGNPFNDAPDNLVPSCWPCNTTRARTGSGAPVADDELFIVRKDGTRVRAVAVYCEWCDEPFLAIPALRAVGKARFCSRSCARSGPRAQP